MCPGIGGLHIPSVLLSTHLPHLLLVSPWCPVLKCQVSFSWCDWLFPSCCSSYLHCEWATISQLEKDKRIHQKLKRFKTKMAQMRHFFHEVIRTQYWLLLLSTVFFFFFFCYEMTGSCIYVVLRLPSQGLLLQSCPHHMAFPFFPSTN